MKQPVVFLDRDGTINEEVNYLRNPKDFRLLPGVPEAIRLFKKAGFAVLVITNQSGLARGYFSPDTLQAIHQKMLKELSTRGATIDGIYFCPHHPEENCECRKPKPGLIKKASQELKLDLSRAYVIGDRDTDILLAKNIGAKSVLVLTGYGEQELLQTLPKLGIKPDLIAKDLLEAAKKILKYENFNS
ncbi:histidinol-phosphate phosphatase family protein [Thermodesulfatator indicus DSM 15286]|uniref:D,D-heptose 1,7-bisphosphate phosphatase n=1 Tax=Thermodesulfatator indicus (strain DSM 15286 / JCM 11887 / CIR29812) TaxID=667014 RepID=F8A951_THEID|nr:D-glycero-beta-D-manno-heptose 1,7-bisphosphate 7-phosphatase [Thermodesulfatator indicus]AEH45179.1 histidinol-phosphate phosphatase family protein [Thermodesulfatator indicus DSM 15286]